MSPERWQQIETLLDEALPMSSQERAALLERACAGDATLQRHVEALLASHDEAEAEAFLAAAPHLAAGQLLIGAALQGMDVAAERDADLEAGQTLGAYHILRPLGRGGMGTVYLAERADGQFHKHVALKVVKRGMDTDEILLRFRYEREILARLEHPNIARLLDAGVTDDGRPYFAMEYVEGEALDAHCDRNALSIKDRLALFQTVCEAVRYAHRNLVVHRDLKPSNILVTREGEVKLLDFGIAKLLEDDLALSTVPLTQMGARRLTPQYAAPEQVQSAPTTPATDVYALGVILYLLMTGRRPYRFQGRSFAEIELIICDRVPEKPSTVALRPVEDGDAATPEALSRQRAVAPKRLRRQLRGDLDAIVMMALRKEPERRYASAAELLEDLRRYAEGRPVVAQPDSVGYRAARFARRHQVGVALTAVVLLLIAALTGFYTARLADERDRANQEAARAIATRDFIVGTFALADPDAVVDPRAALEDTFTKRDLIEANLERIDELSDPLDQAVVLDGMAKAYVSYSRFEKADSLYRRALAIKRAFLGNEDPRVAESLYGLGQVAHNRFENEKADSLYRLALTVLSKAPGGKRPLIPEIQNDLAFVLLNRRKRPEEAEVWYQQALAAEEALLKEHPADKKIQLLKAKSLQGLAAVLRKRKRLHEAEELYREALGLSKTLGEAHPEYANAAFGLANVLKDQEDYKGTETFHLEALGVRRRAYTVAHPAVGHSALALAQLYHHFLPNAVKAEAYYREAIETYERARGPRYLWRAYPLTGLGRLLLERGQARQALPLLRESLEVYRFNPEHQAPADVAGSQHWLGVSLYALGQYEEAEAFLLQAYDYFKDSSSRSTLEKLITLYQAWSKPDEAAPYQARMDSLLAAENARDG